MNENKKTKKKIRIRGILVIILFCYLIFSCGFYLYTLPIKHIDIEGNKYLKDNYIIDYIDINDTSIFKINKSNLKKKILEINLISDVEIKKNIFGTLKITLKEERPLFYNWNTQMVVLSNEEEIPYSDEFLGIPSLINYVPDSIFTEFVEKLELVDDSVLSLVSEIVYSRSMIGEKVVDDKRFLFRMNDGNTVYINTINIEKFNEYLDIYEAIENIDGNKKGCLYLDSNSGDNLFNDCNKDMVVESEEDESEL